MSIFSKLAASARAAHAHYFGQSDILLAEPGKPTAKVTAVLGEVKIEIRREDNRDMRVVLCPCRFIDRGDVRHDSIVTIDNVQWTIDEFLVRQASGLTVNLRRTQVTDINRPNYRRH